MNYSKGLEGVVAGETAISNVEGDIGRLSYRGYAIEDLVGLDYASVMWLVLFGELPADSEREALETFLAEHGDLSQAEVEVLARLPHDLHPMRVLQAMVPLLDVDRDITFGAMNEEGAPGLQIVARMPSLIATFRQLAIGNEEPAFDEVAPYLENFLMMFTGEKPSRDHVEILKVVQVLQMEHSFNAGTFTGRVVASTLAPVDAVISAAIGALFGILHGGADEAALNDAKRVGSPEAAQAWVKDLLARKGRLMGMGHREYRKVDPRAVILKPMAARLCENTRFQNLFDTLAALEIAFNGEMQAKGKEVWANLEFYKGAVYEPIGIPSNYFTAVFAMSRCVGWLAHFIESRADNKIIRPKAAYVGQPHRAL